MQKVSIFLIALLLVGAVVSAQAFEPSVTISGDATAEFNFDLEAGTAGFKNSSSADIAITLVSGSESAGGDGWYGMITLSDFEFSAEAADTVTVTDPSVAAKITNDVIYITLYGAPSDKVSATPFVETEDDPDTVEDTGGVEGTITNDAGITIGMALNDLVTDVYLSVISDDEGKDAANADNDFGVAFGASLTPVADVLDLGVAGFFSSFGDAAFGVAVDGSVAAGPATVGFGVEFAENYLSYGVGVDLAVAPATIGIDFSGSDDDMDLGVAVDVDLAPISLGVSYRMLDIGYLDDSVAAVDVTFADGGLTATAGVDYLLMVDDVEKNELGLSASVALAPEFHDIDNTTLTFGLAGFSNDSAGTDPGYVYARAAVAF